MFYLIAPIAGVCLCVLLAAYALWDTLVLLLFVPRAAINLFGVLTTVLLSATSEDLRLMSESNDITLLGITMYETRKETKKFCADLCSTLITPALLRELKR